MIGISYTVLVTSPAYVLFTTIQEVAMTSVQNKETHLKKSARNQAVELAI